MNHKFLLFFLFLPFYLSSFAQPIHLDIRGHLGAQIQSIEKAEQDLSFRTQYSPFALVAPSISFQVSFFDWIQIHTPILQPDDFLKFNWAQADVALLPAKFRLRPFIGLRLGRINAVQTVDIQEIDISGDNEPVQRLYYERLLREDRAVIVPSLRFQLKEYLFLSFEFGVELGHKIEEEYNLIEGSQSIFEFYLDPQPGTSYTLRNGSISGLTVEFPEDYPGRNTFYQQLGQRFYPRFGLILRIF